MKSKTIQTVLTCQIYICKRTTSNSVDLELNDNTAAKNGLKTEALAGSWQYPYLFTVYIFFCDLCLVGCNLEK